MKIYKERAKLHIKSNYGNDYGLLESSIRDSKDFFAFTYQTLKYIESGEVDEQAVGQGFIFIHKIDGRMFEYGSRLSYDEATRNLRMKINIEAKVRMHIPNYNLQRQYGIIIYKIKKRQIFIETILKSGISFTIPEIVGDSIFRISQPYTKKKILIRLEKLPITFNQVNKHELLNVLLELIRNASCEFKLKEIEFPLLSNNAKGAKGIDLEPIW